MVSRTFSHILTLAALLAPLVLSPSPFPFPAQSDSRAVDVWFDETEPVQRAFDLLLDRYVQPLSPTHLLRAAWREIADEADAQGVLPPDPLHLASVDRDSSLQMRLQLSAYARGAAPWPDGCNPMRAAIRGMASSVQESHTYYLEPERYRDYLDWAEDRTTYGGIGLILSGPGVRIDDVVPQTPAARAALRAGDVITTIDGASTVALTADDAAVRLRGRAGDQVELTVHHTSDDSTATLELVREPIAFAPVDAHVVAADLGYILIRSFDAPAAAAQAIREIDRFRATGAPGIILDLRGNPGGRLDVGAEFLGRVLPAGTPLYTELTAGAEPRLVVAAGEFQPVPSMAVLVDEQTASMAELVAAALQQAHAATVIGRRTAGTVAGGKLFPLGDGSALDVTVFDVQSAQGTRLNGVGVLPDIGVDAMSPNAALSAAIAFLRAHADGIRHDGPGFMEDGSTPDPPASTTPGSGPWSR